MVAPDPNKLAVLQQAIADIQSGKNEPAVDRRREEALAPIRKRALGLLDQRSRSRHELQERLLAAEFAPQHIDEVLDALERAGLVNDAHFANEWVRQRAAARGKSTRALDVELREKGISAAARADALAQISAEDEETRARAVAKKKAREVKDLPANRAEHDKYLRRIVGVLARRGYSSELSLRIAREQLEARIEEIS